MNMRTWTGILTAALAGSILLASCKKQDMDLNSSVAAAPPGMTGGARPVLPDMGAMLNYRIATVSSSRDGMVAFLSGTVNPVLIKFSAARVGSSLTMVYYEKPLIPSQQQLYTPINLGYLNIPKATYQIMTFGVDLGGGLRENSLTLNGVYNSLGKSQINAKEKTPAPTGQIPVRILVNDAVTLSGVVSPPLLINKQDYWAATLSIDPTTMVYGITRYMWENADQTNGQIVISSTSNPLLYGMIVKNLATSSKVDFVYTDPLPSK